MLNKHFTKCFQLNYSSSVQLLSVSDSCDPMDCSLPDFPVIHQQHGACSNSCPSSCRGGQSRSEQVIRVRGGHEGGALMMGLVPL